MASHLRLLCCVFGLLAVQELPGAEGVTFSLDPVETKVDGQAPCGVLHCWEEVKPGSASITSISSLTVYKQEAGRRVTLTTLSREKPIDNGTFDGIEVDGMWTSEKAEVNLSLVEKDDCTQVQFFCQVGYTNGQGREKMSSAVVDGKDATTPEQTEDTPSSESDGKTSVMSGEVPSSTDGTRMVAIEEQLKTLVGVVRSLTSAVSHIQKKAECTKLTALKDDTMSDAETLKEVSKTMVETVRTAMTKDMQSLKNEVKSIKETMEEKVKSIKETMKEEVKSIKETMEEKVKSIKETMKGEVKSLKEDVKSVNETVKEDVKSLNEDVKSVNVDVKSVQEDVKSVNETMGEEIESVKWMINSDRWIVIQRRSRGDVSFYRNWDSYKKGFGSPRRSFWLGNDKIHELTSRVPHELRITLEFQGKIYYASYDRFYIDGEKENYKLHIGKYSGTAGDSMTKAHNNMMFSTFDRDNDKWSDSCANYFRGAWWYNVCYDANLNGLWGASSIKGIIWQNSKFLTYTEMKIRPI